MIFSYEYTAVIIFNPPPTSKQTKNPLIFSGFCFLGWPIADLD